MKVDVEALDVARQHKEFDAFAATVPGCSPFQTGSLAHGYARSPDAEPVVLVARDPSGTAVAGLVAVTFTHSPGPRTEPVLRPLHQESLVSSLTSHTTVRGVLPAVPGTEGEAALASLVAILPSHLPREVLYIRYYPDRPSPLTSILSGHGFVREDWLNFVVDLSASEKALLAAMSKNRRKGIQSAERRGIAVSEIKTTNEFEEAYRLLEAAHKRLRIPSSGPSCSAPSSRSLFPTEAR